MDDLEKDIIDNARLRYERGVKCRTVIGTRLKKLVSGASRKQLDVTYMKEGEPIYLRVSGYEFPDLASCRGEFEKTIGAKIEWEDGSQGSYGDNVI